MSQRLLSTDRDLVNYIIGYTERYGFPPSRRQIADHIGAAPSVTQRRLERLVREGVIERVPGIPRGIRVNRDRITQLEG
jgi:DNA-binding Lrp family transcriptional regulator